MRREVFKKLAKNEKNLTQGDLRKIRSELSEEMEKITPSQREEYLEAAKDVYIGLSKMSKIRESMKR
jgi:uncharacterized protein (UPF0305 family)